MANTAFFSSLKSSLRAEKNLQQFGQGFPLFCFALRQGGIEGFLLHGRQCRIVKNGVETGRIQSDQRVVRLDDGQAEGVNGTDMG